MEQKLTKNDLLKYTERIRHHFGCTYTDSGFEESSEHIAERYQKECNDFINHIINLTEKPYDDVIKDIVIKKEQKTDKNQYWYHQIKHNAEFIYNNNDCIKPLFYCTTNNGHLAFMNKKPIRNNNCFIYETARIYYDDMNSVIVDEQFTNLTIYEIINLFYQKLCENLNEQYSNLMQQLKRLEEKRNEYKQYYGIE